MNFDFDLLRESSDPAMPLLAFEDEAGAAFIQWQPGDGTRYVMTLRPLSARFCHELGCVQGSYEVTLVQPGGMISATCNPRSPCWHQNYVSPKFGRCDQTIAAICAIVNAALGICEPYAVQCIEQVKRRSRAMWQVAKPAYPHLVSVPRETMPARTFEQ
jgi:hypothetical protein